MTDGDALRSVLGANDGETVYEAAERVVRERDAALRTQWRPAPGDVLNDVVREPPFELQGWVTSFYIETPGLIPGPTQVTIEIAAGADSKTLAALERHIGRGKFYEIVVERNYDEMVGVPVPGRRALTAKLRQ